MRTKHWIVAVLVVAVVASAQAYALTMDKEPEEAPQAAEIEVPRSAPGPDRVVSQESPADVEPADDPVVEVPAPVVPVAPEAPSTQGPIAVETLIVGFHKGLSGAVMEAIVRAAGATPVATVSGPDTIVVSVDKADRDATIAQLEAHFLVDYVAVPAAPRVTSSL